ncbi:MAG: elongation factor Ts [Chloroflexi bacterium]|nr:elongation factor Ts [Chloroflexota bacterium]
MVKELRTVTGAGVLDCRNALVETAGDFEKAAEILRKQGMAEAEKRKEREANEGLVAAYIHTGDRMGAMVEVNCETDFVAYTDEFRNLAKELTMQVAASSPLYVQREDIPEDVIAQQEKAHRSEMEAENKPPDILERIISGKMEKFYKESCLLEQPYIRDTDITVGELIDRLNATLGENIVVRRFVRYELGQ